MIKRMLVLLFVVVFLNSCKKDTGCSATESSFVAPASETAALQAYCAINAPAAVAHSSGLYYEITNPGAGSSATICSNVTVNYEGFLTNGGARFDYSTSPVSFQLAQLILGWQKGIPLIKKGGSITLYVPPSLAYGNTDVRNNAGIIIIPANSYLKFTIQLVDVQ
ncbi:MAG: FKBP-type peptidyl-prolyl cis-trans isomerase [Chitinophagaceae bacterium]|nr:FKBP-type peptidyl-prolyl cis-trans isomerase [Chitinophagaceae bacterium]